MNVFECIFFSFFFFASWFVARCFMVLERMFRKWLYQKLKCPWLAPSQSCLVCCTPNHSLALTKFSSCCRTHARGRSTRRNFQIWKPSLGFAYFFLNSHTFWNRLCSFFLLKNHKEVHRLFVLSGLRWCTCDFLDCNALRWMWVAFYVHWDCSCVVSSHNLVKFYFYSSTLTFHS